MPTIQFLVEIEVERESGKFAGRDEIADAILSELESAPENADLSSLGADGTSQYSVVETSITELDNKDVKKLWDENETRVVAELPGDAKLRQENKSLRQQLKDAHRLADKLKDKILRMEEANEILNKSRVWTEVGYDRARHYLPDGQYDRISFDTVGKGERMFTVALDRDVLEVRFEAFAQGSLAVLPYSGNVVRIKAVERL